MRTDDPREKIEQGQRNVSMAKKLWNEWLGQAAQNFEEARRMARAPKGLGKVLTPRRDG